MKTLLEKAKEIKSRKNLINQDESFLDLVKAWIVGEVTLIQASTVIMPEGKEPSSSRFLVAATYAIRQMYREEKIAFTDKLGRKVNTNLSNMKNIPKNVEHS